MTARPDYLTVRPKTPDWLRHRPVFGAASFDGFDGEASFSTPRYTAP
jgi:hypothetical protein